MTYVEPPPDQRKQRPWTTYASPLRYPGGKRRLAGFVKLIFEANDLVGGDYIEPYAGGAAVALELMYEEYASKVYINDIDPAVFAFWRTACEQPAELCRRVTAAELSLDEWKRQKAVFKSTEPDRVDLAFATLYLNRTNRSGILSGGPIGGLAQAGAWRLDARFRKADLVHRIEKIGRYATRIEVSGDDALDLLDRVGPALPARSFVYLDPPYFLKGQENLYVNAYRPDDHAAVASRVAGLAVPWMVSYDDAPEIRALYAARQVVAYSIRYTARERYSGKEVAFFSDGLEVPAVAEPAKFDGETRRPKVLTA